MKLLKIITALENEVTSDTTALFFESARCRHSPLDEFDSVAAMLSFLTRDVSETYQKKEAIVRALLIEHRTNDEPFWTSLVIVAFSPMLCRLRGRILSDECDSDDLDQMVICAFLSAANQVDLDDPRGRICLFVRQQTQRRVFRQLKQERCAREIVATTEPQFLNAHEQEAWPVPGMIVRKRSRKLKHSPLEARYLADLLAERAGAVVEQKKLDLVVATAIQGETVRAYVNRQFHGLEPAALERTYQRIKRQRNRTIAQLREVLYS